MTHFLLVLSGVVGTILVETAILVAIAVRKVLKERKSGGENSRERVKETVVPVLKQE